MSVNTLWHETEAGCTVVQTKKGAHIVPFLVAKASFIARKFYGRDSYTVNMYSFDAFDDYKFDPYDGYEMIQVDTKEELKALRDAYQEFKKIRTANKQITKAQPALQFKVPLKLTTSVRTPSVSYAQAIKK